MRKEPRTFGMLLKQYRIATGMSQEALAEKAHLSVRAISDLERGVNHAPRYETLEALITALALAPEQRSLFIASARQETSPSDTATFPVFKMLTPLDSLIGREQEINAALSLLTGEERRLLTLTGPGGVGKTRLALAIAQKLKDGFEDGTIFLTLETVRDASVVPEHLAYALRLDASTNRSQPQDVFAAIGNRHLLVILDNFEQVIDAAPFVSQLVAMCHRVSVLTTSRMPLHVRGEHILSVPPLDLAAAKALFVQRAQALCPEQDYLDTTVAAICERLDRLPLAIELVAAHVRIYSLSSILEQLTNRLPMLQNGARDLPQRQRSMRDTIAWSYDLLTASQQQYFRALSVCSGSFTLEAVRMIVQEDTALDMSEVLYTVEALVDASLLQVERTADNTTRFHMLETIREYAAEALKRAGEEAVCQRRHALYYAHLAGTASIFELEQATASIQLVRESANAQTALSWAVRNGEEIIGLQLVTCFGWLWLMNGNVGEARRWIDVVLALDGNKVEDATFLLWRSLALCVAVHVLLSQGNTEQAQVRADEAMNVAERSGNESAMSKAFAARGIVAQTQGNFNNATTYFTASHHYTQFTGNDWTRHYALLNLAEVARMKGELAEAAMILQEVLAQMRATASTWGTAITLTLLANVACQQKNMHLAQEYFRESLLLYRTLGNKTYTAWCIEGIATLACEIHRYKEGATLCAVAATLRAEAQTPLPSAEQKQFEQIVSSTFHVLGEQAFRAAWSAGERLTQEAAVDFALEHVLNFKPGIETRTR